MKRNVILLAALFAFSAFGLVSCDNDDSEPGRFEKGAFVLNEGAFNNSNASVSWVNYNTDSTVNGVFESVNKRPLGDVLQSAIKSKGKIYLVVNNSGKVEVVNSTDFMQAGVIENLNNPRYAAVADDNIYISQWNGWGQKGAVMVYSTSNLNKVDSIPVGTGAEGIIYTAGRIWLANSGGFGIDSTIFVINPNTNKVEDTLFVGFCPKELVTDANGKIWAICSGTTIYDANWNIVGSKPSSLAVINPNTKEVEKTIALFDSKHPSHIDISPDKQTIYFGGGYGFNGIFSISINATSIPEQPSILGSYYGFNVNPNNGDIYCLEAPSFTGAGVLKVYASDFTGPKKEVEVGIGPNGVIFN
jgi:hypothetical protein